MNRFPHFVALQLLDVMLHFFVASFCQNYFFIFSFVSNTIFPLGKHTLYLVCVFAIIQQYSQCPTQFSNIDSVKKCCHFYFKKRGKLLTTNLHTNKLHDRYSFNLHGKNFEACSVTVLSAVSPQDYNLELEKRIIPLMNL